ncbi:MAG: tRNA pseudouridine(38-40) synthase TruA [Acidobacteriota bacterium]|nr:tRNA pseudouridine(38-40) synthase TruA [Acidobacteriota bacterium]
MPHWKLILTYDGTPYHGWQVQPNLPTIQGTLAQAILRITGESVLPQGSGRTDTGVHALAQVASFTLHSNIPAANLHRALNHALPPAIRVLSVEQVPPHFHARHSAVRKTYEYRIFPSPPGDHLARICSPMLAPYIWACPYALNAAELNRAAAHILGPHDFTSFAACDPDLAHRSPEASSDTQSNLPQAHIHSPNTRTIFHSAWKQHDDLLLYRITGSGFLHHMVRNLVGTFAQIGARRLDPDAIPAILAARNRRTAGPTAPASGLFLVEVEY